MKCNLSWGLVAELAFSLSGKLSQPFLPAMTRRKVALECRTFVRGVPSEEKRFVIRNLREGIKFHRKDRIERRKFLGSPYSVEAGRRVDEERDSRQTGGPAAVQKPASHHPATTFPPVSDAN